MSELGRVMGEDPEDQDQADRERDRAESRERIANLMAANRFTRPRDPEGMGADTWRPWP